MRKYLLALALAGGALSPAVEADTVTVTIINSQFLPNPVDIKVGDVIMFKNNDVFNHTATSGNSPTPDGKFNINLSVGAQRSTAGLYNFDTPNVTIPYFCVPHATFMKGVIRVGAAPTPKRGDINGNDTVDAQDLILGLNLLAGTSTMPSGTLARADVFPAIPDNSFDMRDVVHLARHLAGLDTTL